MKAVNGVSFTVNAGEAVGVVGESGSGKSQIFMSVMGLLASNGRAHGSVKFQGQEILGLPLPQLNKIRGERMSMIFQDPMTSLNPYLTINAADDGGAGHAQGHERSARPAAPPSPCSTACRSPRPRGASTCIRTSSPAACASG